MRRLLPLLILAPLIIPLTFPLSAAAEAAQVTVASPNGEVAFSPFARIGSIAAADLGNDGTEEILVGAGAGEAPQVAVYRQDGTLIGSFMAYAEGFTGGVNVAACDVDGDGFNEIVTGAKFGGGPHVRIFSHMGALKYAGFFAYDENFRGGVNVACADVDENGIGEIITGPGLSGGPHIKTFSKDGTLLSETFSGSAKENTGALVRANDDGIHVARAGVGDATVYTFRLTNHELELHSPRTETREDFFSTLTLSNGNTLRAEIASELASDTSAKYIRVDLSEQRMYVYEYGIQVNTFLVSTAKPGYITPIGKTTVTAKLPVHDYVWYYGENNPENYNIPNVKWNLRFRQHYYIHSAFWHNNFGRPMSHGCVNMSIPDAEWVFNWAEVGTPVEIVQ